MGKFDSLIKLLGKADDAKKAEKLVAPLINEERARRIAEAYDKMPHNPSDPEVKAAYDALIKEVSEQYKDLVENKGLKVSRMKEGMENPYPTSKDLINDVKNNNHMWYYPTEQGFGSGPNDFGDHPMLRPTDFKMDDQQMLANDLFRVVHDYYGHVQPEFGFKARGEEGAWRQHMPMFSPEAQKALTTETRGQNSWVNYGPYGEQNRLDPKNTKFADQKAGLLPDWARDMSAWLAAMGLGGAALAPDQAQAEPFHVFLKGLAKSGLSEAEIAKKLEDAYRMASPSDISRDQYGKFMVSQMKEMHPELANTTLDPDSLKRADEYINNKLGLESKTNIVTKQQLLDQPPDLVEKMTALIKQRYPKMTDEQVSTSIGNELREAANRSKGFFIPDVGTYLISDKYPDVDTALQVMTHEPFHALDHKSGKKFSDTIMNPNTLPEGLNNEGKSSLAAIGNVWPGVKDKFSVPEYEMSRVIDANVLKHYAFARENPELYNEYVKQARGKQWYELDNMEREMFPEYMKGSHQSVGHSTNLWKGIEKSLADDLIRKNIDPLSTERANAIVNGGIVNGDNRQLAAFGKKAAIAGAATVPFYLAPNESEAKPRLTKLLQLIDTPEAAELLRKSDPEKYKQYIKDLEKTFGPVETRAELSGKNLERIKEREATQKFLDDNGYEIVDDYSHGTSRYNVQNKDGISLREIQLNPNGANSAGLPKELRGQGIYQKILEDNAMKGRQTLSQDGQRTRDSDKVWNRINKQTDAVDFTNFDEAGIDYPDNPYGDVTILNGEKLEQQLNRSSEAAFDPRFKKSGNIMAGLTGAASVPFFLAPNESMASEPGQMITVEPKAEPRRFSKMQKAIADLPQNNFQFTKYNAIKDPATLMGEGLDWYDEEIANPSRAAVKAAIQGKNPIEAAQDNAETSGKDVVHELLKPLSPELSVNGKTYLKESEALAPTEAPLGLAAEFVIDPLNAVPSTGTIKGLERFRKIKRVIP